MQISGAGIRSGNGITGCIYDSLCDSALRVPVGGLRPKDRDGGRAVALRPALRGAVLVGRAERRDVPGAVPGGKRG